VPIRQEEDDIRDVRRAASKLEYTGGAARKEQGSRFEEENVSYPQGRDTEVLLQD